MEILVPLCLFSLLVCATAMTTTTTMSNPLDVCPSNLNRDRFLRVFGNSCYSFHVREERNFDTAERICEETQGHLVTVKDAATQQFLYSTLHDDFHYRDIVWIGLSDVNRESEFVWVDGTPADYTNWAPRQPGVVGGLEDCVAMDVGDRGRWHDFSCQVFLFLTNNHVFVCEYPLTTQQASATPTILTTMGTAEVITTAGTTGGNNGISTDNAPHTTSATVTTTDTA